MKIAPPPPLPFELRVILWRADNVKSMDEARVQLILKWMSPFLTKCLGMPLVCFQLTKMNDLYARLWMEGQPPQESDVHWRYGDVSHSRNCSPRFLRWGHFACVSLGHGVYLSSLMCSGQLPNCAGVARWLMVTETLRCCHELDCFAVFPCVGCHSWVLFIVPRRVALRGTGDSSSP